MVLPETVKKEKRSSMMSHEIAGELVWSKEANRRSTPGASCSILEKTHTKKIKANISASPGILQSIPGVRKEIQIPLFCDVNTYTQCFLTYKHGKGLF